MSLIIPIRDWATLGMSYITRSGELGRAREREQPFWTLNMFSFVSGILSNVRQSGLAFTLLSVRTYKVRSALKLKCSGCKFVRRKGRLRVICKNKNTHKQKQGWWLYFGYLWSQLLSGIIHRMILPSFQSYLRVWIYDWIWTMVLFCTNRLFVIWSLEGKDFLLFGGKDNLIQL